MFKKLLAMFGFAATATKSHLQPTSNPIEEALLRQIAERSKSDPLIGAKIGSKEITRRLIAAMKNERGIHTESLLCALGSLAGYSCQAALRTQALSQGLPETKLLLQIETKGGKIYFFGDHLNKLLAESQYSVWSVAGGGAQQSGCSVLPDLAEIFKHVSSTLGDAAFGVPRVPESNKPHATPIDCVRSLWPALQPLVIKFCPKPEHWPILFALSIQEVIEMGKSVLDPCLALRLVMESAIPMSKVNLNLP